MVRQTARFIFVEALGVFIIFLVIGAGALAMRLAAGPMSIDFVKADIEEAIGAARDGRAVKLGELSLQWLSSERRAIVVATDFDVFDDAGELVANAQRVEILLDAGSLVRGKIEAIGLVLDNGWIGVNNMAGGWTIAGDPIGRVFAPGLEADASDADWLTVADETLRDVLATLREDAGGLALRTIEFSAFEIVVGGDEGREIARLKDAYGDLKRDASGIDILIGGSNVAAENAPGRFTIGLSAPANYSQIDAELGFLDWSLQSVLDWVPAYSGRVEGFATDASLAFRVSDERGLETLDFGVSAGAGRLVSFAQPFDVSALSMAGKYTLEQDRLIVEVEELVSTWAAGQMTVTIDDALHGEGVHAFSVESKNFEVDLTRYFSDKFSLDDIAASGTLALDSREVDLDRFGFSYADATVVAAGRVAAVNDRLEGELPIEAKLEASLSGELDITEVLQLWPQDQGRGARRFVSRSVPLGTITNAQAELAIARDSTANGHLADEALNVTFVGENVNVKPLPDIPLITGTTVNGLIKGNSVALDFGGGVLDEWELKGGRVAYPQLSPAGEDMILTVEGVGPARNLLEIISDSRLQLRARSGFDPATVSGTSEIKLELRRPALPDAPLSSIRYKGEGQLIEGGMEDVFAGLAISQSAAQIEFDQTHVRVFGDGVLQSASLSYDWLFPLGENAPPAEITASSVITPDLLNHLGVSGRAFMTGNVPVDITGTLRGKDLQTVDVDLDFQEARLDIAELGWVKPFGDAAIANIVYERAEDEAVSARVNFSSPDASFVGAVSLADDGKLIGADIDSAKLADRFDVGGTALRTSSGGMRFDVSGDLLDLSQLVPNFAAIGGSEATKVDFGDVALTADISTLVLGSEIDLSDAKFALAAAENGLQTIDVQGKLPNGSPFTAAFDASGLGDPAFIVTSGDAGFLPNLLFGSEFLQGGELQLTGTVGQDDLPTQVHVVITDGRLIQAPVVTQILSIASLRGLSDTLSGDGILFSDIEVPLSIRNGRYDIVGAKASGPALGLTAKGWINPSDGRIDVDGVLVPSFGVNSALGGLPLIGDLFVSRDGEGVFSLRYGVEGTLERAQVSVNPLSAITPGVLRRIFESPETAELPPLETPDPRPDE